jgi:hypothetical protein
MNYEEELKKILYDIHYRNNIVWVGEAETLADRICTILDIDYSEWFNKEFTYSDNEELPKADKE